MNLERLLELVFNNPDDISIEYSNRNGKETLIVNGENLISLEENNDSQIKQKIADYKAKLEMLDDHIFEKVIDAAEKRKFNLCEMNKGLDLKHYTEKDELFADNVINLMTELIQDVLKEEIQKIVETLEQF